jgi:hypothetical protein
MQKKDIAPCNNQLKRTKNGRQKRRLTSAKKVVSRKVLPKIQQEATESEGIESNRMGRKSPPPLPKPIHYKKIGWEHKANVGTHREEAPVYRELGGHTLAGATRTVLALRAHPWEKFHPRNTEWMGIPSPRIHTTCSAEVEREYAMLSRRL